MHDRYYQRFLNGFGADGEKTCSCGVRHRIAVREVLLGGETLAQTPDLIRRYFSPAVRIWVLSDGHTEEAAGSALKQRLAPFEPSGMVLQAEPKPACTLDLAGRLAGEARRAAAGLILSVGGGTVSDLGKKVSADTGIPNWCLMTAPSVDAFTSGTSNIKGENETSTLPVTPSQVVLGDLPVLAAAPEELFLAGLGDLLAKFLAFLDWRLAALVTGEPYCPESADFALLSARAALQAARTLRADRRQTAESLADAGLTSGLIMQSLGGSRPAASAEHTASHLWEVAHCARTGRLNLHGTLVGLASRLVLNAYRDLYAALEDLPLDIPARAQALSGEPSWQGDLDGEIRPFRPQMERQMAERVFAAEVYREQLLRFERHRSAILELARGILGELEEGVGTLTAAGFPFRFSEFGMTPAEALLPFRYIRYLRNRFSSFDLMHLLGLEREIYGRMETRLRSEG